MKSVTNFGVLWLLTSMVICGLSSAHAGELGEAVLNGKTTMNLRYRYEQVDQSNIINTANASTIRLRLGYTTADVAGFSVFVEMEDVHKVGVADYTTPNAGPLITDIGPKEAGYPVVADPVGSELNQSYLQFKNNTSVVRYGRQRIIRGNARFVGNVGWRQNEQTFDAFSIECSCTDNFSAYAAYIANRNTITMTDIDMDTVLLDVGYKIGSRNKLSAYYYDVQVDDAAPKWESIGLRFNGKAGKFKYSAEYAKQEQANGVEPDYTAIEASYISKAITVGIGLEVLGSDNSVGFATPLATLHKFNGWADQFLATPAAGLEDSYINVSAKPAGIKLALIYHDFSAETGSLDYGDEVDLLAVKPFSKQFKLGAKYASYSAGDIATAKADVDKIWLWAEYSF